MAMRLRLYDCRISELPGTNGLCKSDVSQVADLVNRCQRRLLYAKEAGSESWWGTFSEIIFSNVSRTSPFLTGNRWIARIEALTVCREPVPVSNQFQEYLDFGNGRMPRLHRCDNFGVMNGYTRNNVVTFADLPAPPQKIRLYSTDPTDAESGFRVLIQGKDQNGSTVYSFDGPNQVTGEYVNLDTPFAETVFRYSSLTGIQKDTTAGTVQFFAVDDTAGTQTLFHTMEPGEQTASYRRYFLNNLPNSCCHFDSTTPNQVVQVKAICKLELVPVVVDQDYCLIQNLEALIEEAKCIHFSDLEGAASKQEANFHHIQAIRLLKSELVHYLGQDEPAVIFAPFGSAKLSRLNVGMA